MRSFERYRTQYTKEAFFHAILLAPPIFNQETICEWLIMYKYVG